MTIEEVVLLVLMLPIGVMAILAGVGEIIKFAFEKIELKELRKKQNKTISAKSRENEALKELLAEAENTIQNLIRERTECDESQNTCS